MPGFHIKPPLANQLIPQLTVGWGDDAETPAFAGS
jgi:hypothetical protein